MITSDNIGSPKKSQNLRVAIYSLYVIYKVYLLKKYCWNYIIIYTWATEAVGNK